MARGRFVLRLSSANETIRAHRPGGRRWWAYRAGKRPAERRQQQLAAWEFSLQDGGVSEGFTHKMAAGDICLQDGGNAKQTKRKQKQRRIYHVCI